MMYGKIQFPKTLNFVLFPAFEISKYRAKKRPNNNTI